MFYKLLFFVVIVNCDEIFEEDLSKNMKIGLTHEGYKSVRLKCDLKKMDVEITMEYDFLGVIYTRGSFYEKNTPCYLDCSSAKQTRIFNISFNLDKCKTKREGNMYSNVLILQHDKELIMPGDAAFNLECDYRQFRDVTIQASLNMGDVMSRITLTDADPAVQIEKSKKLVAENSSNSVVFTGKQYKKKIEKIEL